MRFRCLIVSEWYQMGNAFATPRPAATRNGWTVSGTWYPMCATVPPSSVVQAKLEAFGRVNIVRNNDGASGADNIFAGLVLCDRYQFDRRGAWRDVVGRLGRCAQARVATLSAHHVQRSQLRSACGEPGPCRRSAGAALLPPIYRGCARPLRRVGLVRACAKVKLDDVSKILGLSGKPGIDDARVEEMVLAGEIEEVPRYCETDVLNTYRVWLMYKLFRGSITTEQLASHVNLKFAA
jgi:hypothetical protein